jgi:phosphoribosylanthranilate isomerase
MTVVAKICGLNTPGAVAAAVAGGARFVGFVFYPPSPRAVTPARAAGLANAVPAGVLRVGLFVDPDDATLDTTLGAVPLDMIQLHGSESPGRTAEIGGRFGRPTMKAIKVRDTGDVASAGAYDGHADWLLFDAKPPTTMRGALPGGNALSFDWHLLAGRTWQRPWMLSGGLNAENVAEAVAITGARAVDVSSGVEARPGEKSPALITAFLDAVAAL